MNKLLLFTILFGSLINFAAAQLTIFSDNFESGTPSTDWGIYRANEEVIQAKPMGEAPVALTGGGDFVGYIHDIDISYTGVAIALAGDIDAKDYTIEADVFCYVNNPNGSAYTGLIAYADSSFQGSQAHGIYYKLVADFDASDRFRLYNNQLNFSNFAYTFHEAISATGLYTDDAWHHMKLVVTTVDENTTEFKSYFDGNLIGTHTDAGVDQLGEGRFGIFAFQQSDNGLAGYFDNIVVTQNVTAIEDNEIVATKFKLGQNYPNPFNPSTTIEFDLSKSSHVDLKVYNITGKSVKTLVNETMSAGAQKANWDGTDSNGNSVAAGVYLYSLKTEAGTETKKMILIK